MTWAYHTPGEAIDTTDFLGDEKVLKKTIGVAFAAAAGLMMMSGAANAGVHEDFPPSNWNNNVQLVPIQLCNSDIAILGVQVPVGSPETTGPCINGSVQQ